MVNNLILAEEDSLDTDSWLLQSLVPDEDEDLDTPILRVFVMFKILLINLVFGCIFTVICLSVKRSVGRCLSYLTCGLCGQWDCDYDGSHIPRSRFKRKTRNAKRNRNQNGFKDTIAYTVYLMCKNFYSNKKLVKKAAFGLLGVLTGLWMTYPWGNNKDFRTTIAPIYAYSDAKVITERPDSASRVYFVTPTAASGIQTARLTNLAQALYPNRDFVTWVIVSADPVQKYIWADRKTEHWDTVQMSRWKRNEKRILEHLDYLNKTISRFGVPFVIISGHDIHHSGWEFTRAQLGIKNLGAFIKASQVGVSWVAKTFQTGTLLVGADDGAYNFNLFRRVRDTKLISSWPLAFDNRYRFALSTPYRKKKKNFTLGYFSGGTIKLVGIPLQYGGYAINMKLVKKISKVSELWKLSFDGAYSSTDLNLTIADTTLLARNYTESEVYFWKTTTVFTHAAAVNRAKVPLKFKWIDTNIEQIDKLIKKWFAKDLYTSKKPADEKKKIKNLTRIKKRTFRKIFSKT